MFQRDALKNPPVWGTGIQKADTGSTSVSSKYESHVSNKSIFFPIDLLPLEILYLIMEKLDADTLVNCMLVNRKWRSVIFCLANGDKTNRTWQTIYNVYHEEDTFSTKSCGLPYKDLFANLLRWNLDFSISLHDPCLVNHIKKISIYRDNIIVVDFNGVKYFDVYSHTIKRSIAIRGCLDFIECDSFILRNTEVVMINEVQNRLFLYGKNTIHEDGFESTMQRILGFGEDRMDFDNSILICDVAHYVIEKNRCYVMNSSNSVLSCYTWQEVGWTVFVMGRYYGNQNDNLYAMNVLNKEILLLTKWGQMIYYCYKKQNFQQVHRVSLPAKKNIYIKMVHKYCIVIGVPSDFEFRITRIRNNQGYNHYKFECPNLSCATEHGEMLFLGFRDGKIEIFMPRAVTRKDMFKRRLYLTDFTSEPPDPVDRIVISIDVFEDFERHFLFISTYSVVHHLVIEHKETTSVWDNIYMKPLYYKYPISTRYAM